MISKSTIEECRHCVDQIDLEIVRLLNERADCSKRISEIKRESGLPIHQPEREKNVLDIIIAHSRQAIPNDSLTRIYTQILAESRLIQSGNDSQNSAPSEKK